MASSPVRQNRSSSVINLFIAIVLLVMLHQNLTAGPQVNTINRNKIIAFLGTSNAKVVFASGNDSMSRFLYYIDMSEADSAFPRIHKIASTQSALSPSISPDGKLIAYNTGVIEQSNVSSWMCSFNEKAQSVLVKAGGAASGAHEPRFIKHSDSTELIYTTTWQVDDWAHGQTMSKRLSGGLPDSVDRVIYSQGSFHGGLSYDNRYLCSTMLEPNPRMVDLTTNTVSALHSLLCQNKVSGIDTIINPQCCNCSISSSRIFTNVMMYMDFGLPTSYTCPAIGSWTGHQKLFLSTADGKILRWYDFSDSLYPNNRSNISSCCWQYSEWSVNHPYYAIAGSMVQRYFKSGSSYISIYFYEDIYLINLKTASYLKIAESTDNSISGTSSSMQWPNLWVDVPQDFVEDSTWLAPSGQNSRPFLRDTPAKGKCPIRIRDRMIHSENPIRNIQIYTAAGRLVFQRSIGESNVLSFEITKDSFQSSGMYILRITTSSIFTIPYFNDVLRL